MNFSCFIRFVVFSVVCHVLIFSLGPQVIKCADAGADLVRITVQGKRETKACKLIREKLDALVRHGSYLAVMLCYHRGTLSDAMTA